MEKSNLRKLIRKIISEQAPASRQPKLIRNTPTTSISQSDNGRALTPTHTTIRPTSFPPYISPDVGVEEPEEEFDFPYEPDGVIGKPGIADLSSAAAATIQNLREQAAGCDAGHSLIVSKECSNPSAFTEYCLCCQIENQPVDPSMVGDFYEESQFGAPVIREILGVYGAVANDEYDVGEFKSNCGTGNTSDPCDTSPTSACATQWFGNNASNFTNYMASKNDCDKLGNVGFQLASDITALWQNRPNQNVTLSGINNFNDIKVLANDAGFTQPQKGQWKRKTSKFWWANCVSQACNC